MGVPRKQLHVPVLPLHVPEGPFLGGRHPYRLRGLSRGRGLRGRLGRWSLRRLRGLGSRCWDGLFGRHRLRGLRLVFASGRAASALGGWLCGCRGVGRRGHGGRSRLRLRLSRLCSRGIRLCSHRGVRIVSHFSRIKILILVVEENCKRNAGAAGVYDVAVYICQFEAQGAQGNGAVQFDEVALVGSCLHDVPHAFVDNHFADDILTQRPLDVGSRGQGAASEQQFRERVHGHEGKDLQGAVDEGGAQQVVDAQGAAGRGARRVAPGAREEASDLIVVQDAAIAVVGDSDFVGRLHVGGRGVVAADPRGQSRPRVGSDGQHRPVEGLQGLIDPIEVLASVRAEEGVGHTELEDGELGARLEVKGLADVKLEGGVVSGDSLAAIHIDRCRHPFPFAPETPPRRLLGACAVTDLPGPLGAGPAGVHDAVGAGAAVDVVALTVAERASPQELAHHLAQDRPHLPRICDRNAPKTCLLWALAC